MRRYKRASWVVVAVVALAVVGGVQVAQAEEGTVRAAAVWEGQGSVFPVGKNVTYMVAVYAGVLFVDDGTGPLHANSMVCPATGEVDLTKGTKTGEGRCVITDPDGDRVFARFTCSGGIGDHEGCEGPFTLVDGTGKFEGITGEGAMISRIKAKQVTSIPGVDNTQQQGIGQAVWPALHYNIPE